MYRVVITQGGNSIGFEFNHLCDATAFISECMETGDEGTSARIEFKEMEE